MIAVAGGILLAFAILFIVAWMLSTEEGGIVLGGCLGCAVIILGSILILAGLALWSAIAA